MNSDQNYVITIGRQFGSGGRELGKQIATKLGISYYDKELLNEAAKQAGVSPEFFEHSDERFPTFTNGMLSFNIGYSPLTYYTGSTAISDDSIYSAQSNFIRTIADKDSCVIVGRSADYVLRDHPRVVNLFVHASMKDRIARIMRRGDAATESDAKALAEKTNKLRANYYNFYTDKKWGDASGYDLTINSSLISMDDAASVVAEYIKLRFKIDPFRL